MSPDKWLRTRELARNIESETKALQSVSANLSVPERRSRSAVEAAKWLLTLLDSLQPDEHKSAPGFNLSTSVREHRSDFFDEDAYLYANPDVANAVASGVYASGKEHWLKCGRAEVRPGGPLQPLPERSLFLRELESRRFGVNLYGFLTTASGLGQVARGFARAIELAEIPMRPIDVAGWQPGPPEIRPLPDFEPYRVNLIMQNADMMERFAIGYGAHRLNGCYNVATWFWELPSLRASWFSAYRYADEIWVASEFCKRSVECLTSLPVVRMPVVVDGLEKDAIYDRQHFGLPQDAFIFCYVFDISSQFERKNPLALVKAFREAFGGSSDVLLCLKFSNSSYDKSAREELRTAVRGAGNIVLFDSLFSNEEIVSLHNVIDCMVSPHRSEGFGLNLAEAMYFSKPVIATGYSSNLDFMNEENSYLVDYKLTPMRAPNGPYLANSVWAEPSHDHLVALLERVFRNREERERKARAGAREIREQFSVRRCADAIRERLTHLGLDQETAPAQLYRRHGGAEGGFFAGYAPAEVNREIRRMPRRPVVSVITPVYNVDPAWLRCAIQSVKAQWYPFWELCLCDDGSTSPDTRQVLDEYRGTDARIRITRLDRNAGIAAASNRAVEISTGEFLAMLDNDDELTPDALYEVVRAVNADNSIDLLYTDEDKRDAAGSLCDPYFKPDWSPEHLHSVMYMLHLLVIRKEAFYRAGEFRSQYSGAQDYDLALRASAISRKIEHIPKILYHWRMVEGSAAAAVDAKPAALDAGRRALENHVQQTCPGAYVEAGKVTGVFRVRYPIVNQPLVSICIPTHDQSGEIPGRGEINFVSNLARSIAEKTNYRNYELLICDDRNLSAQTRSVLRDLPHRLLSFPVKPASFNFSAKVNFLFEHAGGEHVVLMNDDMEVISREWLDALLEHSQRREIGAVGARLLFADGRIQHVGVVIGVNGGAAHVYHSYPGSLVGYNAFTHIVRNYSAVTAACLATRKSVIEETGGFDPQFPVDYNDIDFCLRLVERGYRVVYTPYAELYHFENQTAQRRQASPEAQQLFVARWARFMRHDPCYNPSLSRNALNFAPAQPHVGEIDGVPCQSQPYELIHGQHGLAMGA